VDEIMGRAVSVLSQLSVSSPVSYLVAFVVPALDAVLPVLPSETVVIALGVATAGRADPRIAVLVALAACGAFAGDNLCYFLGRRFAPFAERRLFSGQRGARTRAWADQALQRFGARLIVVCRFIPGGRTAVTFTRGAGSRWPRYAPGSSGPVTPSSSAGWAARHSRTGRGSASCSRSAWPWPSAPWWNCSAGPGRGGC
jgi:membrane protein YqaA with SNARE-associated domain